MDFGQLTRPRLSCFFEIRSKRSGSDKDQRIQHYEQDQCQEIIQVLGPSQLQFEYRLVFGFTISFGQFRPSTEP